MILVSQMKPCNLRRAGVAGLMAAIAVSGTNLSDGRAEDAMLIKPAFEKARKIYLETKQEVKFKQGGSGGAPAFEGTASSIAGVWQSAEGKDGNKLKFVFDRVSRVFKMGPMGQVQYDSDVADPDETPYMRSVLKPMLGMDLNCELDGKGGVTSFVGMTAIVAKIEKDGGAAGNPMFMQMKQELTDKDARAQFAEARLVPYANREVKVGETWAARLVLDRPMLGKIKTDYKVRLDRIGQRDGHPVAELSFTGTTSLMNDEPPTTAPTSAPAKPELEGTVTGTAVFNPHIGQITMQESEAKSKIKAPGPGGALMEFDLTIASTYALMTEADRDRQKAENLKKGEEAMKRAEQDVEDEDEGDDGDE